jgi:rhodanese-related sulfurtransferase
MGVSDRRESTPATDAAAAVDQLLARARAQLDRVAAEDLAAEVAGGAVVVDIRPVEQRERDGTLPGAIVVDRNVLEWRLDPTSPHRIPGATSAGIRYVVVCNEGFSSSLAAATLRELGLSRATDLVGGFQAWLGLDPAGTSGRPATSPGADRGRLRELPDGPGDDEWQDWAHEAGRLAT